MTNQDKQQEKQSQQTEPKKDKKLKPVEKQSTCVEELQKIVEEQKQQIKELKELIFDTDESIKIAEQQKQGLTDIAQRLQAEFENYKKRTEKERCELTKTASKDIIANLLPVLDSFQHALKNKDNVQNFINGMELIYAQLYDALAKQGLRPIDALHKKFNPYYHEVVLQEERSDVKEDDIITEEFQKGYMLCDHVLRHSKVKIAKKKRGQDDNPTGHA